MKLEVTPEVTEIKVIQEKQFTFTVSENTAQKLYALIGGVSFGFGEINELYDALRDNLDSRKYSLVDPNDQPTRTIHFKERNR